MKVVNKSIRDVDPMNPYQPTSRPTKSQPRTVGRLFLVTGAMALVFFLLAIFWAHPDRPNAFAVCLAAAMICALVSTIAKMIGLFVHLSRL